MSTPSESTVGDVLRLLPKYRPLGPLAVAAAVGRMSGHGLLAGVRIPPPEIEPVALSPARRPPASDARVVIRADAEDLVKALEWLLRERRRGYVSSMRSAYRAKTRKSKQRRKR